MSVVCDTSVIIDFLRGDPQAVDFLAGLDAPPSCSEVTRIEVTQGLRSHERSSAYRLFGAISWVVVDQEVAERAGELGRVFRASHGLGSADLCVAASAIVKDLPLATMNVKHFPMFPDLQPPYRAK